jgi:hypothetical protein
MLKLSNKFIKIEKLKNIASFTPNRNFNYQKDVYIKKFELPNDKNLQDELKNIYSIRNQQPNLYRHFIYSNFFFIVKL